MMKFITTINEEEKEEIFLFPKSVNHDCMMEMIARIKNGSRSWRRVCREPISAGFVIDNTCSGKSETLNLSARPEDTDLLKTQLSIIQLSIIF